MKKFNVALLLVAAITLSKTGFSQDTIHSGIIHTISDNEETNLIKIHCESLNADNIKELISAEYGKYPESIRSVDFDVDHLKIYIKFSDAINPNMLLGILERVYIKAYYLDAQGTPIFYEKTGTENFKR
jgi:hypothetical protein